MGQDARHPEAFRRDRPILGSGRGRIVVLAVAVGALVPVLVLRHHGDALVAARVAGMAGHRSEAWDALARLSSPAFWLIGAIVGFGVASGLNLPNFARWMGMLALGVLWAALADIAVAGEAARSATVGMAAVTISMWLSRAWPICAGAAASVLLARVLTGSSAPSNALVGTVLGGLGPLVLEYFWHTVRPDAAPERGADWQA